MRQRRYGFFISFSRQMHLGMENNIAKGSFKKKSQKIFSTF
jgi:hypothetical protein